MNTYPKVIHRKQQSKNLLLNRMGIDIIYLKAVIDSFLAAKSNR